MNKFERMLIICLMLWCGWLTHRFYFLTEVCVQYEKNIKLLAKGLLELKRGN